MTIDNIIDIMNIITAIVASASAISAMLPGNKYGKVISKIKTYFDLFAFNIGNARNK
jgi:hypothetical protein